jgi:hypothetical protein
MKEAATALASRGRFPRPASAIPARMPKRDQGRLSLRTGFAVAADDRRAPTLLVGAAFIVGAAGRDGVYCGVRGRNARRIGL